MTTRHRAPTSGPPPGRSLRASPQPLALTLAAACLLGLGILGACRASGATDTAVFGGDEPTITTLRVLNYNAWLMPFASAERVPRRDAMVPVLAGMAPDVLCLQEVWLLRDAVALRDAFEDTLPYSAIGGGGTMLLSRYPFADERFVEFAADDELSFAERMAGKGMLEARVVTPAGPVVVLTTHLVFDRREGVSTHERQVRQLIERVRPEGELGADTPVIVCGDLNLPSQRDGVITRDFERLVDEGRLQPSLPLPRPATRLGWPRGERRRGWDPDYVMYRGGREIAVAVEAAALALDTPESALSDHNAILVDFLLTPAADTARAGGGAGAPGGAAAPAPGSTP
jgi:endonuclease/exonuclease/phosphatase family metal-dependent hydrolase